MIFRYFLRHFIDFRRHYAAADSLLLRCCRLFDYDCHATYYAILPRFIRHYCFSLRLSFSLIRCHLFY